MRCNPEQTLASTVVTATQEDVTEKDAYIPCLFFSWVFEEDEILRNLHIAHNIRTTLQQHIWSHWVTFWAAAFWKESELPFID